MNFKYMNFYTLLIIFQHPSYCFVRYFIFKLTYRCRSFDCYFGGLFYDILMSNPCLPDFGPMTSKRPINQRSGYLF